mmetsp:Transcript_39716/g.104896  ORF Transcript_39716/g.104896 Transcript_39716/m.104896 type:complete len:85 (+) Transcript_39716:249-503(+)
MKSWPADVVPVYFIPMRSTLSCMDITLNEISTPPGSHRAMCANSHDALCRSASRGDDLSSSTARLLLFRTHLTPTAQLLHVHAM